GLPWCKRRTGPQRGVRPTGAFEALWRSAHGGVRVLTSTRRFATARSGTRCCSPSGPTQKPPWPSRAVYYHTTPHTTVPEKESAMNDRVTSLRLPSETLARLRRIAHWRSLETGEETTWGDLAREALDEFVLWNVEGEPDG